MFYILRVNLSIAALGVSTQSIRAEFRQLMQAAGMKAGNSPQEVALWIVSQLPVRYRLEFNPAPIKRWIRKRKIDPDAPEVQEALMKLGIVP